MKRVVIDGFGQIELNNVAFRRDGRIEAQCALDTADFNATTPAENGMILAIDKANGAVSLPSVGNDKIYGLVYSAEHIYDERTPGLKNFANYPDEFLPRLGYLAAGDLFTTNCVCYDTATYATETALKTAIASGNVYGGVCADGAIALYSAVPTQGPVLFAVKNTTMPDSTYGVKFQVLQA